MAGASINDIKSRIKSVEGTMQITKAMELVATSKLRHAKSRAEGVRPYLAVLREAISNLGEVSYGTADGKTLVITVAGDRGLAGGYNSNIFKLLLSHTGEGIIHFPIGKKAIDYASRKNLDLIAASSITAADLSVGESLKLGDTIAGLIKGGEVSEIKIIYTKFVSMLTQTPVCEKIYPISNDGACDPLIESEPEEILAKILPQYIGGFIYGAVSESVASECASRRSAMNSANKNAEEMIGTLTLQFNRARQAVITQEITEIVSGAEAL